MDPAEGWHREFLWTQRAEDELTRAPRRQYPDRYSRHYVGQAQLVPA